MICLAPLAGVTDMPVREFFSRLGAELTHTEMISCSGLVRDNLKTLRMIKKSERENDLIIQFFSHDENILLRGAEVALSHEKNYYALGINMACPMPKVTKTGAGAALLRESERACRMVKNLKILKYPVWVKIRKLENYSDTLNFVEKLINAGADNICIHGRTQAQRYEGVADREILKIASKNFPGYISASGDVRNLDDINEYLFYGCDPVMIARGAVSNPWIFQEVNNIHVDLKNKIRDIKLLAGRALELYGEHYAAITIKHFSRGLFYGVNGAAELRNKLCQADNLKYMFELLDNFYNCGEE